MIVHPEPQRTPAWYLARMGKFTASEADSFCCPPFAIGLTVAEICEHLEMAGIAHKKNAKKEILVDLLPDPDRFMSLKLGAQSAIDRKIAEWAGVPKENEFQTPSMKRGTALEPIARQQYRQMLGLPCVEVGFVSHDTLPIGCSPDDLVLSEELAEGAGAEQIAQFVIGGCEIKAPDGDTQIRYLREQVLPSDYLYQVHQCMAILETDWWDFFSISPKVTQWTKTRDAWHCDAWEHSKIPAFYVRTHRSKFTDELKSGLVQLSVEFERQRDWLEKLNG